MAAVMSSDMQNTDKVVTFIEECRAMKLELLLPDVNSSEFQFTVTDDGAVVYGLGAIKGLGEGPVESIVSARKEGPFTDLFDFCNRTDPRTVNKRALEALILSGAFDALGIDRAVLMAALPDAVKAAEQSSQNAQAGMIDLFSMGDDSKVDLGDVYEKFINTAKWSGKIRLEGEKDTLGLYVTGHPIDDYEHELKHLVANRIVNLRAEKHPQLVVGLIVDLRVMKSKSGNNMAFATLDDRTSRIEVGFFGAAFEQCREMLIKDKIVVVQGKVAIDDYNGSGALKVQADSVMTLDQARQRKAGALVLKLNSVGFPRQLHSLLLPLVSQDIEQSCPVIIEYTGATARGRVQLSDQWRVFPGEELIEQLQKQFGLDQVVVEYGNSGA
jgi:DNA polymerase-3 subunit alpha